MFQNEQPALSCQRMVSTNTQQAGGAGNDCEVFISHTGLDSGSLAGSVYTEMKRHGLVPFLDEAEGSIQAGSKWREKLWKGAWSCRVFILLLSPNCFHRPWPILELCVALQRACNPACTARAVSIFPVFVAWKLQQAASALQDAADHPDSLLQFTAASGAHTQYRCLLQPDQQAAEPLEQHAGQQASKQFQLISEYQQPNTQRKLLDHCKEYEAKLVTELGREARRIIPRFRQPERELLYIAMASLPLLML